MQCVNWLHPYLFLSLSFNHSFTLSCTPSFIRSLSLSLTRSLVLPLAHWSAYSRLSFHSRDNFPRPSFSKEETRQNVIVYVIWILQHFTCPGFSDAAVFVARKSNGRRRWTWTMGTRRCNKDLPSEINEQLARKKVAFRNKFTLDILCHQLIHSQIPFSFFIPSSNHYHFRT